MFEDLLIALENLEEQDHKKRGELTFVAAKLSNNLGTKYGRNFCMVLYFAQKSFTTVKIKPGIYVL